MGGFGRCQGGLGFGGFGGCSCGFFGRCWEVGRFGRCKRSLEFESLGTVGGVWGGGLGGSVVSVQRNGFYV